MAWHGALKASHRRALVDELTDVWKVSIRKACNALRIDRSLYTYKSKRGEQADLKHRIKQICETRLRYGGQNDPSQRNAIAWFALRPVRRSSTAMSRKSCPLRCRRSNATRYRSRDGVRLMTAD